LLRDPSWYTLKFFLCIYEDGQQIRLASDRTDNWTQDFSNVKREYQLLNYVVRFPFCFQVKWIHCVFMWLVFTNAITMPANQW
jgi:hypothetical protein